MTTVCFYTNENDLEERNKWMILREVIFLREMILRDSVVISGTVASHSQDVLGSSEKAEFFISIGGNMGFFSGEQFRV